MATCNPFAHQESHSVHALNTYRVFGILSWALVAGFGIWYSIEAPTESGARLWDQFNAYPTLFSINTCVASTFWILLLLTQICYIAHLFSKNETLVTSAANVAGHFILNNFTVFAWIWLFARGHLRWSEVMVVINYLNQSTTYWRNKNQPALIHLPVVAGPYAWSLFTLFWGGSIAVNSTSTLSNIAAYITIWVILVLGKSKVVRHQDYLLGEALSLLSLGLALEQYSLKIKTLQWIFAWVVFALFVISTAYTGSAKATNRDHYFRPIVAAESTDAERQPLLNDEATA